MTEYFFNATSEAESAKAENNVINDDHHVMNNSKQKGIGSSFSNPLYIYITNIK